MEILNPVQAQELLSRHSGDHNEVNKEICYKVLQKAQLWKNDVLEANARNAYYSHLIFMNELDEAIVQYSWLLNRLRQLQDQKDTGFPTYSVIWGFKWIIDTIPMFGNISKERIEGFWKDFTDLMQDYGMDGKINFYFRMHIEMLLGHPEKALEMNQRYLAETREGFLDDCPACQRDYIIELHNYLQQYDVAAKQNNAVIAREFTCAEVPQITFSKLCLANLLTGNLAAAENFYQLTMQELGLKVAHIDHYFNILYYLGCKGEFTAGIPVLRTQLPGLFKTSADFRPMHFSHAMLLFLKRMQQAGYSEITLPVPQLRTEFPGHSSDNYPLEKLIAWLQVKITNHSTRLDTRNGNAYWSNYLNQMEERLQNIRFE